MLWMEWSTFHARPLPRELDGRLIGLRAGVAEEGFVRERHLHQLLRQLDLPACKSKSILGQFNLQAVLRVPRLLRLWGSKTKWRSVSRRYARGTRVLQYGLQCLMPVKVFARPSQWNGSRLFAVKNRFRRNGSSYKTQARLQMHSRRETREAVPLARRSTWGTVWKRLLVWVRTFACSMTAVSHRESP